MKKNKPSKYLLIFYITSIILIIYSLYLIIDWFIDNKTNSNLQDHITDITTITENKDKYPYIETDLTNLIKENKNTVGWIQVPDTNINYSVVQGSDNDYYLNHNFYNESNSAGWVFLDYRNNNYNDDNTILYAHNRLDNSMFGTLKETLNYNWHSSNKYIYYNTIDTMNTYQVFSVYNIDANDFKSNINFEVESDYLEYLKLLKSESLIDLNVSLKATDKIITLYTCSSNNKDRTILHAKLVQSKKVKE